MFLRNLADIFAFFIPFEKNFSFLYLLILSFLYLYLIIQNRKTILKQIKKIRLIAYGAIIFAITFGFIWNYSPFSDSLDSRSEDYKLAAKYYAQKQKYVVCNYGQGDDCFMEAQMEKAPGYSFLLSLFYMVFGISSHKAVLFNLIIALCTPIVLFLSLYIMTNNTFISFLTLLLLVVNKKFIEFATQTSVMNITIFFIVLSFFFMSVYFKSNKKEIIILVLYSLLFLSYMRAEYLILLVIFFVFTIKDITKIYNKQNKYFFYVFIMLLLFLILHSFTETRYHTSPGGNLFSFAEMGERLIKKTNIFLFKNFYIVLLPFIIFSFDRLKKTKSFAFYPIVHLIVFSFLILVFQHDGGIRYFAALVPSLFIIIGIGSNNLLRSKFLNDKFWRRIKYCFITFIYISFFLLSLPYHKYDFNNISTSCFDDLVDGLDNSVLFIPNQPLVSRTLLGTDLTAAIAFGPEFVKQILNSTNRVQSKYLIKLDNEYHLEFLFPPVYSD